jgi:glycerophosphoryl diester phosphodiesterase
MHRRFSRRAAWALLAAAPLLQAAGPQQPEAVPAPGGAMLVGLAILPAETFDGGPPAGQFVDEGRRLPSPRFGAQPVQGVSSVRPGPEPATFWALSDNGFGARGNSYDYRLALYLFRIDPRRDAADVRPADAGRVELLRRIVLADPRRVFPYRLVEESDPARPFTGADLDPESLVTMPDGSFWIGEEFGPWLLHFGADGALLEPPVETSAPALRSPQHPRVAAGAATASIRSSRGFEALAAAADGRHLIAMLEAPPLTADGVDVPLLEFDLPARRQTGRTWRYPLDAADHSIGELSPVDGTRFLVVERDDLEGDAAEFKRIFAIDLDEVDGQGRLRKRLVADLLAIGDPRSLSDDSRLGVFRLPYWCIESVVAVDPWTILVVNDNNFPDTGGRGAVLDRTEWVWLRLGQALSGAAALP